MRGSKNLIRGRCRVALSILAGTLGLVCPSSAQTKSPAIVTLSNGNPCNSNSQPHFGALSVATNISFPDSRFGAGSRTFSDIVLTKNFDDCSISLYSLLFMGTRVSSAVISFVATSGPGQKTEEVMRITLTNALITSIADSESELAAPAERVTLSYERIEIFDPITNTRSAFDRGTVGRVQ